jgi:hypothetical protein
MLRGLAEMALGVSPNACKLLGDATQVAATADAGTRAPWSKRLGARHGPKLTRCPQGTAGARDREARTAVPDL